MLRSLRHVAAVSGVRALLMMALCACAALPARAQDRRSDLGSPASDLEAQRTTMARALFEEGLRFVDAGQWADARDRFSRVLELRYSAVAAYNLGLAQARLGHGVVAAATLRKLLAEPALDAKVREPASALLRDVEAHFGWLRLRVLGDCAGCNVRVGVMAWPPAALGVSVPIDPGRYALELRWRDVLLEREEVEIAAAARVDASLSAPPEALEHARELQWVPHPVQARTMTQPAAAAAEPPNLLTSPWFWGAMGVLAVGAVTAVVLETR